MLLLSATLCCHWRHSQCTVILPLGAIQSCHLVRSGLDCHIQWSAAPWRLRSEPQAVTCGLPVILPEPERLQFQWPRGCSVSDLVMRQLKRELATMYPPASWTNFVSATVAMSS